MASSGCARARTGSVGWRATAWPNASVVENGSDYWEAIEDRDVWPDQCWRKRPSKGHAGIRYWLRTRGRDLRIHRNHANPPRFERRSAAYKCIMGVLQYAGASASAFVIALVPRASWHERHQPFPELQTQQPQAARRLQRG